MLIKEVPTTGFQIRVAMDKKTVAEYKELMKDGTKFPPITIYDVGGTLMLVDGFHRLAAAKAAKLKEVEVEIQVGTRGEALKAALSANQSHGLRRTNADKRIAMQMATDNYQEVFGGAPSAAVFAQVCGVSQRTAESWYAKHRTSAICGSENRVGADGRVTNTTNIGKKVKAKIPEGKEAFLDNTAIKEMAKLLRGALNIYKGLVKEKHPSICHFLPDFMFDLEKPLHGIDHYSNIDVCPNCNGTGCHYCENSGFVTKYQLNQIRSDMKI